MGIGTLLIGLAVLVIVVVLVAAPLLEDKREFVTQADAATTLGDDHKAVIREIRELDLDYRTGKLSDVDYRALRLPLVQRGAVILEQIHTLPQDVDETDRAIEDAVSTARKYTYECQKCGNTLSKSDVYCAKCGAQIRSSDIP
jgi:hypothetical protein